MYKAPSKADTSVTKAILPGGLTTSERLPSGKASVTESPAHPH
jgi:hypothetical protein